MKLCRWHILIFVLCFFSSRLGALSSLAKNDPYPVYSTVDPQDYLFLGEKYRIKDPVYAALLWDNVGLSLSPFGQNAECGKNIDCEKANLGDLTGRWGMIALMYGPVPPGQTMAPALITALNNLFPGVAPGNANDPTKIDPASNFGFFSVPLKYRKRGLRMEVTGNLIGGFGINLQTGIVCMSQTMTGLANLTDCVEFECQFDPEPITGEQVNKFLMNQIKTIAEEIKLNICDFSEISIEEVRINLYWRKAFELNNNGANRKTASQRAAEEDIDEDDLIAEAEAQAYRPYDTGWPHTILFPFFEVSGSVSPGQPKDPDSGGFNKQFALPFGNNGHSALGVTGGLAFDFVNSLELASSIGVTYFLKKNFDNFRLPTSIYQSGIYPFRTDVSVQPGINWQFTAKIGAHHFLDKLSVYFEYVQLEHKPDTVCLRKCEDQDIFLPEAYEKLTGFKVKLANTALNYDITPNISLGMLWQIPLSQMNAYRSSTVLFSFNANF